MFFFSKTENEIVNYYLVGDPKKNYHFPSESSITGITSITSVINEACKTSITGSTRIIGIDESRTSITSTSSTW